MPLREVSHAYLDLIKKIFLTFQFVSVWKGHVPGNSSKMAKHNMCQSASLSPYSIVGQVRINLLA